MAFLSVAARTLAITLGLTFVLGALRITFGAPDALHGRWNPFALLGAGVHVGLIVLACWLALRLRAHQPARPVWRFIPWGIGVLIAILLLFTGHRAPVV